MVRLASFPDPPADRHHRVARPVARDVLLFFDERHHLLDLLDLLGLIFHLHLNLTQSSLESREAASEESKLHEAGMLVLCAKAF